MPIDVSSGVFSNAWLDLHVSGKPPLIIERSYSTARIAADATVGAFGRGWRHALEMSLRAHLEGYAFTDPDGVDHQIVDLKDDLGRTGRLLDPKQGLELRRVDAQRLKLVRYAGGRNAFDLIFRRIAGTQRYVLESLVDDGLNRVDLVYERDDRLVRVVQVRSGQALLLKYGSYGLVTAISLLRDHTREERRLQYEYDPYGRLVKASDHVGVLSVYEYDHASRLRNEAKHTGAVFTYDYDDQNRCVHATGADHYEERRLKYFPVEHRTEMADSHGAVTAYEYNDAGQVVQATSPLGAVDLRVYDADGRLVAHTDANGATTKRSYDALGRFSKVAFPDGKSVTVEYDDEHQRVALHDPKGLIWRCERDVQGRLLKIIEPNGSTFTLMYSGGDLTAVEAPWGGRRTYEWSRAGQITAFTSWAGALWRAERDENGYVIAQIDPLGQVTRYERDAAARVVRHETADGRVWTYDYDAAGRLIALAAPDGSKTRLSTNSCGLLQQSVDGIGHVTVYTWDTERGRLLEIRNPRGDVYRQTFDADGRTTSETYWDGRTVRYEYDALGNCVRLIDGATGVTEYAFNEWGRVVSRKTPDGVETVFEYDENRLPTRVAAPGAEVLYERDDYGRVTAEIQNGRRVASRYDAMGARVWLGIPTGRNAVMERNLDGLCTAVHLDAGTISFQRDLLGQVLRRELGDAGTWDTSYDAVSRPLEDRFTPRLVSAPGDGGPGLVPASGARPFARSYQYDTFGHPSGVQDSFSGRTRFVHDHVGRLSALFRDGGDSEAYGYDFASNRTWSARGSASEIEDLLSRIGRQAHGGVGTLPTEGAGSSLSYARGNRLETLHTDRGLVRYRYDARGFPVEKIVEATAAEPEVWRYEWDGGGRLVAVHRPNGETWRYTYDGLGRRLSKKGPGEEIHYVWDFLQLVAEISSERGSTSWLYEPETMRLLVVDDGATHFLVSDASGVVREVVAADGRLEATRELGPWGETRAGTGGLAARFVGQWYDPESGWSYNLHRYYDADIGRYVSPDPIGLRGGFNEYAYVPSPVEWADPFGLSAAIPGGGPFPTDGGRTVTSKGRPDGLAQGNNGDFNVPPSKCVAQMTTTDPNGGTRNEAFVSGIPDAQLPRFNNNEVNLPPNYNSAVANAAAGGINGNWTHAEMHAMSHLLGPKGPPSGSVVTLHIDRPPCTRNVGGKGGCEHGLAELVAAAKAKGIELEITYMKDGQKVHYPAC